MVMVCIPGWENYFDLGETVHQIVKHLMDEEEEEVCLAPKRGATIPKDDNIKIVVVPPNEDTILVPTPMFPGHTAPTDTLAVGSTDNPVNLSDVPTDALNAGYVPRTWVLRMNPRYSVTSAMP